MARAFALGVTIGLAVVLIATLTAPALASAPHAPAGSHLTAVTRPAASPPNPFVTHMAAALALGAPNFTGFWNSTPPNASSFVQGPQGSCFDAAGDLWVPDFGGNRLMEFKPPFAFRQAASIILGQPNAADYGPNSTATGFSGPDACAFDSGGHLWVTDYRNSRVLEFVPPFTTGMAAHLVLGQSSLTGSAAGTTAKNLSFPVGVTFDPAGDLWVVDTLNSRVLEFAPPFTSGMAASTVLGQTNFTGGVGGTTASNLSFPQFDAFYNNVLWVTDALNNRVVGFPAPFTDGEGATYLLGQTSFTSNNFGTTGPENTSEPLGLAFDSRGDLWVASTGGNRVTEFLAPVVSHENASVAIGQPNLVSSNYGVNATALWEPIGVAVAPNGNLWVSDNSGNRVLEYVPSNYTVTYAEKGLPGTPSWSVVFGGVSHPAAAPSVAFTAVNGSYPWTVPTVPNYAVSPSSGVATVNGGAVLVNLTFTAVTYSVTFVALGLPSTSNWSVTFAGTTHASISNGSIAFTDTNGTYSFVVPNVSGFTLTPSKGTVHVAGANQNVSIAFAAVSPSSSSPTTIGNGLGLVILIVVFVVGLLIGMVIGRRRKREPTTSPAAPWSPPPPEAPPAGTSAPPPPPPGAGGPPPGAVG